MQADLSAFYLVKSLWFLFGILLQIAVSLIMRIAQSYMISSKPLRKIIKSFVPHMLDSSRTLNPVE